MVIVGSTDSAHPPDKITIERHPTGVGLGDLLLSRQYSWHFLSNMADRQQSQSSTQPVAAALSEVNIISLIMFLKVLNIVLNGNGFLFKPFL